MHKVQELQLLDWGDEWLSSAEESAVF